MNILTISTLSNKGGAAYIAKTLHQGFIERGHQAKYLVGYGKNGLAEVNFDNSFIFSRYKIPFAPHLNWLSHRIIGKDLLSPEENQLVELIKWADIIVCHTLHSYFVNFDTLLKIFVDSAFDKKIIMVAHDSWHYTGRCAFVFQCQNWKNNCKDCSHKNYYPSSLISIAEQERGKKISKLKNLSNLSFVSPAEWLCKDLRETYQYTPVELIRNSIETKYFEKEKRSYNSTQIEICVSAIDLSQDGKVDLNLIEALLELNVKVHFVGKNNPFLNHKTILS